MSTHTLHWTFTTNPTGDCGHEHGAGEPICWAHVEETWNCQLAGPDGMSFDADGFTVEPEARDDQPENFTRVEDRLLAKHGIDRANVTIFLP